MKIAVIDLGTNTFNLLIAQKINNEFEILYSGKESVKLGKGGIGNNLILPDAIERAKQAINLHMQIINKHEVNEIVAIGTSALRTAGNAKEFSAEMKQQFGIDISVISGDREADLIYKGVKMSMAEFPAKFLVLDIGGGSNEFILADKSNIIWKQSFPLGMARIIERFKPADPMSVNEIAAMEYFFEAEMNELFDIIETHPVDFLVGAEGAFESFYNTIQYTKLPNFKPEQCTHILPIETGDFFSLHNILIHSNTQQRQQMKGIERYRIEMVVPASIFVNYIVNKLNIRHLRMSPFSLKEGVVWERFFEK